MTESIIPVGDLYRPLKGNADRLYLGAALDAPPHIKSARSAYKATVTADKVSTQALLDSEGTDVIPDVDTYLSADMHEHALDTAVFRCDYVYVAGYDSQHQVDVSSLAPSQSYYHAALSSFMGTHEQTFYGVWTREDMEEPITLAELALIEWGDPHYDKDTVRVLSSLISDGLRVVTLEDSGLSLKTVLSLPEYPRQSHRSFSDWLDAMSSGKRGIPLPLALAMVEYSGIDNSKSGMIEALQTQVSLGDLVVH